MSEASRGIGVKPHGRTGTLVAGRWRVGEAIGSGGMATVYAVTAIDGQRGALKLLHVNLSRDASTRARFLREGKVANRIGHPGVVRVLDDGVTDDQLAFLVLELLEGETIEARRVRMGGTLPLEEVLDVADQALDALAAAHALAVVHRDVKPDNFFLCQNGVVKLLDFGLAHMKDGLVEETRTGVTIGTPEFMPPEQALGRRAGVDARSDIWGLGATMFRALTGEYVHDAPTLHEQLKAVATRRARPIRALAPEVPPAIASVIDRALELEMQDRWASARQMQTSLRAARIASAHGASIGSVTVPAFTPAAEPASGKPSSSERTMQMDASSLEATVALPSAALPVSPMPVTARMSHVPAPNPYPPAFTPSEVRAIVDSTPWPPSARPDYLRRSAPPPVPAATALPAPAPLRSSARGILVGLVLFLVSALAGVYVAWRYFHAP